MGDPINLLAVLRSADDAWTNDGDEHPERTIEFLEAALVAVEQQAAELRERLRLARGAAR